MRQLHGRQIKAATITAAELAATIAGSGLSGGAGSALAVNLGSSGGLQVVTDELGIKLDGSTLILSGSGIKMGALTGDVTTSGLAATLATVNSNVGSFGSSTQSAVVTVNAKGLVTAASNVTIAPAASSVTGGAALTKADDTNVTLTLGGTPASALLVAASLTLGWTGTLAATRGGTGTGTYAVGDLLYASTTSALSRLADVAVGSYLRSGGVTTAPLWSTLILPNAATANRIVYATSSNTWGESGNLTFTGSAFAVTGTGAFSGDFAVNTNKFTVAATTGNTVIAGTLTAGSGSVGILDATGKIPAISSTYFASLAGTNLTGVDLLGSVNTHTVSGTHNWSAASAGSNRIQVENTTSGTGATASYRVAAGTASAFFFAYSQGYTTSGYEVANGAAVLVTTAGGLSLASTAGVVRVYASNTLSTTFSSTNVIFANGIAVDGGTPSTHGIYLPSATAASSTNTIENRSGNLYFNGVALSTGGGSISGTAGTIAKFTSSSAVGNSIITESGSAITVTGTLGVTSTSTFTGLITATAGVSKIVAITDNTTDDDDSYLAFVRGTTAAAPAYSTKLRFQPSMPEFTVVNDLGTGATYRFASFQISGNAGSMLFWTFQSDFVTSGPHRASGHTIQSTGANGLAVYATQGDISFWGSISFTPYEMARFDVATGNLGIGFTAPLARLAVNGGVHVGGASDPGDNNLAVDGTALVTGVATFTAAPVFSSGTASQTMELNGSKALVTASITGTGSYVKSASPTLTGTALFANATLSGMFKTGTGVDSTSYTETNANMLMGDNTEALGIAGGTILCDVNFYLRTYADRKITFQVGNAGTNGGYMDIYTKPDGGSVGTAMMRLHASRGISIGSSTDPGAGNLFLSGRATSYNGATTAGWGLATIVAVNTQAGLTGMLGSTALHTVGGSDGAFEVSANVNVVGSTSINFQVNVTFTDEGGSARTISLGFMSGSGAGGPFVTITGNGEYHGLPVHIRAQNGTSIAYAVVGTATLINYNVQVIVRRLA